VNKKTILVTGCSSGIGLYCATTLHQQGYRVVASARRHDDVEKLRQSGLHAVELDLDDSNSIEQGLEQCLSLCDGRLDALFNNAGMGQPGAVEDLRRDVIRQQFETNVFGTMELTNRVIPIMRKQKFGRIIQNSSVLGFIPLPFRGAYNASKFALGGLSDTLRLELEGSGIALSVIEPGAIVSRFRENALNLYRKNIDRDNSVFAQKYAAIEKRLQKQGHAAAFTLPPSAVYKKLLHALESRRPKPHYYVTVPTHMFAMLKRILSHRTMDRVLLAVSRGEYK